MGVAYPNTYINVDCIWRQTAGGGTWTQVDNITTFDYFLDTCQAGDAIVFGRREGIFHNLSLYIGTAFAATSVTFIWEYWAGTTWKELTILVDGTNNWTTMGAVTVTFEVPDDWHIVSPAELGEPTNTIDWNSGYSNRPGLIRCRIVAVDTPTEGGANSTNPVQIGENIIKITGYSEDTPCTPEDIVTADVSGSWGVFERTFTAIKGNDAKARHQYVCRAYIEIGDESTPTWFKGEYMDLMFTPNHTLRILNAGNCQFGNYDVGNDCTYGGCRVVHSGFYRRIGWWTSTSDGTIKFYGSDWIFSGIAETYGVWTTYDFFQGEYRLCRIYAPFFVSSNPSLKFVKSSTILDRVRIGRGIGIEATLTSILGVKPIFKLSASVQMTTTGYFYDLEITDDFKFKGLTGSYTHYLRNCIIDTTRVSGMWGDWVIHLQFQYDLKVVDSTGTAISGATVVITDKDGAEIFNDITDGNGDIATQYLEHKRGTILAAPWNSANATWADKTPHTVTISKAGYETKTIIYTMDRKREEVETLELYEPHQEIEITHTIDEPQVDIEIDDLEVDVTVE